MLMVKLVVFTDRMGHWVRLAAMRETEVCPVTVLTPGEQSSLQSAKYLSSKHFCPEAQRPTG